MDRDKAATTHKLLLSEAFSPAGESFSWISLSQFIIDHQPFVTMESKGRSKNDFSQKSPGIPPSVSIQMESEGSRKPMLFQLDRLCVKKVGVSSVNLSVSDMDVNSTWRGTMKRVQQVLTGFR